MTYVAEPGVDLAQFPLVTPQSRLAARQHFGLAADAEVVGVAARLVRDKGMLEVLGAAEQLLATRPRLHFLIAGTGVLERELRERVLAAGLADRIHLLGCQETAEMPRFYAAIDLLVLASRREGRPISVMEAVASGLPVVATPVGDIPLMVKNGINGVIINGVEEAAIAQGIAQVLESPSCTRRAYQHNTLLRHQFDYWACCGAVEGIYQNVALLPAVWRQPILG
ncbi:MAG: glycosyltransferase [Anaerolineae bacterium]|nr:glycosyltransferase [Anaerolineae bacterium]